MVTSAVMPSFSNTVKIFFICSSDLVGFVRAVPRMEPPLIWMSCHVADGQRLDLRRVALGDVFEAVAETDDFVALIDAFNRGRRDDAVESGCRTAADQNSQSAFAHVF